MRYQPRMTTNDHALLLLLLRKFDAFDIAKNKQIGHYAKQRRAADIDQRVEKLPEAATIKPIISGVRIPARLVQKLKMPAVIPPILRRDIGD